MMSCIEIINPNEPIHLFIPKGASRGKNFTLILLIQALIGFYNTHRQPNPLKRKLCSWHIPKKQHFIIRNPIVSNSSLCDYMQPNDTYDYKWLFM